MTNLMTGQTALVTGASSVIGEVTAAGAAELGLRVAVVAGEKEHLEADLRR